MYIIKEECEKINTITKRHNHKKDRKGAKYNYKGWYMHCLALEVIIMFSQSVKTHYTTDDTWSTSAPACIHE